MGNVCGINTCVRVGAVHDRGQRRTPVFQSITLHIVPLRWGLSVNLELGWQTAAPQVTVSPPSTELGLEVCGAAVVLHGHCGLNSGLHDVHQLLLATEPSLLRPYFNQCRICKLIVTLYS